jgi:lipopolysaccharide/colanic/teichoic acid biosynthesis glycosyltransferase
VRVLLWIPLALLDRTQAVGVVLRRVRPPARRPYALSRRKRALDVVVAGGALILFAPATLVALAAIRLESHGHPIYRQRRVGLAGEPFELYKLRTMVAGAEHMGEGLMVNVGDARITRVGALLRRTSLDEVVEHATLRLDVAILLRTLRMVVTGHGLYKGETGGWREPPASR